jgi:hypothetical protein
MKRNAKYLLLISLTFSLLSCNEWIELQPPDGLIREEYWKTKEDVETLLMSAYETLASMDRTLFIHGEIRADMVTGDDNQRTNEQLVAESNIYPDNSLCNWRDFYTVINSCNEVIKNAPEVQLIDNTFTDFQLQNLMAEAIFIRSLTYFYLVRIYKDVPLVLEPSESDNVDFYVEKSTEEEVLDRIITDLEAYRLLAPNGNFTTVEENKGRASKNAFEALLADIYLWKFDYEKVIEHVELIEASGEYFLLPGGLWFELYYPGNSPESIFELQFDGERNQRNGTFELTFYLGEQYDPSQKALELFSLGFPRDLIRGENSSIRKYSEGDYIIWKYVGRAGDGKSFRSGNETQSCNWIIYRYADVLLMKAEALSQLERYSEAQSILNLVRERAEVTQLTLVNNPVAFEDAILEERARELAFEGKRWFDLLRMGRRNDFARKSNLIEIIVANVPSTQKRIIAAKLTNPLGWYLPIYESELERNLNLEQNPYYN